jgi:hypothetical protein
MLSGPLAGEAAKPASPYPTRRRIETPVTEPADPTRPSAEELAAQDGYRAYGEVVGWRNHQDLPMPAWENLTPRTREGWTAAVTAAAASLARIAETRNPARVAGPADPGYAAEEEPRPGRAETNSSVGDDPARPAGPDRA